LATARRKSQQAGGGVTKPARQLLATPEASPARSRAEKEHNVEKPTPERRCPCCGGRMIVIETFEGVRPARSPSPSRIRIDTS
jgi:hypothetical protein